LRIKSDLQNIMSHLWRQNFLSRVRNTAICISPICPLSLVVSLVWSHSDLCRSLQVCSALLSWLHAPFLHCWSSGERLLMKYVTHGLLLLCFSICAFSLSSNENLWLFRNYAWLQPSKCECEFTYKSYLKAPPAFQTTNTGPSYIHTLSQDLMCHRGTLHPPEALITRTLQEVSSLGL
jgi:hypothetical protein